MDLRILQTKSGFLACIALVFGSRAFGGTESVELTLRCRSTVHQKELQVTVQNVSSPDTAIVMGMSIGNGRAYAADNLPLDVRRGSGGLLERYRPAFSHVAIAGRVDPWIVPLPTGSEFSPTLPLNKLRSPIGDALSLGIGDVHIRANLVRDHSDKFNGEMVGPGLVKVFTGALQSGWLRVPGDCQNASQ